MNQNKLQVSGQFLYSFTVVAKHMSFTKAAEDLCITQSAVSHRIRCLEQELGFPLFHRLTRKIILTEEGKTLYGALDASLKQIHETIRNIQPRILPVSREGTRRSTLLFRPLRYEILYLNAQFLS